MHDGAPVWGIIGGAGPRAGLRLAQQLMMHATGPLDAQHPALLLDTRPLSGISEQGPVDATLARAALGTAAHRLTQGGANHLLLACVSAHRWMPPLPAGRFVDVRAAALAAWRGQDLGPTVVLECAVARSCASTQGSVARALEAQGVAIEPLTSDTQAWVDHLILQGMAGTEVACAYQWWAFQESLRARGVQTVVLGCSDLGGLRTLTPNATTVLDVMADGLEAVLRSSTMAKDESCKCVKP